MMMPSSQIRDIAVVEANSIEINWEELDNPKYRADFESVLQKAVDYLPELESLYNKLTSGKSVVTPDEDTPLEYVDLEKYSAIVGEELYNGYILAEVYHKYAMVQAVINADQNNPLDNA